MRKVVCAVALAMAVLPAFSADLRLIVRNPSPFDLKDAPVSSGVPWPRGLLQSAENLRLVDRLGVEHPLQAEVLGRWPEGSVKWTLLDLQATVKKSSATTYTLQYGNGVQRATHGAEGLLVEENDRGYAVSTREATFWVRTTGFNLLDRVTLRGQKAPIVSEVAEEPRLRLVVAEEMARIEHPGGTPHVQLPAEDSVFMGRHDIGGQWFPLRGFRVLDAKTDQPLGMKVVGGSLDPTGKQRAVGHGWCEGLYLQLDKAPTQPITIIYPRRATTPEVYSAQLGPCRVAFETQGPVRTVIRASGRFQAPDGSSLCDYVARLHFYSGKPYVRLQLTVTNRENLPLSSGLAIYPLLVRDLSVSLPLALRGTQHFAISGRQGYGSSHRGTLVGPEDRARLVQYASRASRLSRYVVIHGEDRIATGHAAAGGIGLRDEAQGAVLCVRELWANNPKALRATGRGRIEAALFPEEAGPVDDFVAGRAKTHDILLLFHGEDVPSPVELSVAFDAEPTACLAAGATGGYRGLWAANALNHQVAPLTGSPYDRHFTSDFDELLRTREFTGSYGIWNHGAQGIYRQRVVDLIVRRASMGSVQAAGLVGLDGAVGMGLAIDSGSAVTLGRPEPVLVSSMERDQGIASFTRSLDPVPDRGARALLYDPWGAYLGHRYDVGYAIAREYLRRGEPALLHTARNAAFHLADVSTHHGIRGGGVEWIGACQDASRGRTEHHVPGLSHDASWYAGAWLTFLLSGDRALLHSALENAGSAARHADRDDVTVQAAALAILNLSYAADVAAATSPADARTFERALGAYIDKLLAL
ncbi:hypothetical protein HQ560_10520, partial [bacterium]|nr:hypothetical protein [bacterium]